MRRAAKVDLTQRAIVSALEGVGAKVWLIGKELDAVVFFRRNLYIVDFKSSSRAPRTETQKFFLEKGWPISFWSSPEEALRAIGAIEGEGQ